jgi:hypothetical protein
MCGEFHAIACIFLAVLPGNFLLRNELPSNARSWVSDLLSETVDIASAAPSSTTLAPSHLVTILPTPFYHAAMSSPIVGDPQL